MDVIASLEEVGGIIHDSHLILKSGRHGTDYVNFDYLFPHPGKMWELGGEIVECDAMLDIPEAIIAPAVGGVALVTWVAAYISQIYDESFMVFWADKYEVNGSFVLERGVWGRQIKGRTTVAIEDVATTTGSVAATVKVAQAADAEVVAVIICVNRTGKTDEELTKMMGVTVHSLSSVNYPSYEPKDCPACVAKVPMVTDVGHGASFHEDNPNYSGGFTTILDK
jgi:orotate phosphoribosyltransferase